MLSKETFKTEWILPNNLKLLVAASGGIDSMCLIHLLKSLTIQFSVAHVNYNLRGEESKRDELFLTNYCQENQIPFFIHYADILNEGNQDSNIQQLARTIRYKWFEQMCAEHQFDYTLTAHHADDQMETLLLNLTRGTGIAGMRGIAKIHSKVYRPLLSFTRKEIAQYVQMNEVQYVDDSSNQLNKYSRNKIRHLVLPELTNLNPKAVHHFFQFSELAQFYHDIIQDSLLAFKNNYFIQNNNEAVLDFTQLTDVKFLRFYVYECIQEFGFNRTDSDNICASFPFKAGNTYFSSTHQLTTQSHKLHITPVTPIQLNKSITIDISSQSEIHFNGLKLLFEVSPFASINNFRDSKKLFINYDLIESTTLSLESINPGDRFTPYGMIGSKKINDFFTDKKIALHHRIIACKLKSKHHTVAVLPFEIDHAFSVNSDCKFVLIVYLNP